MVVAMGDMHEHEKMLKYYSTPKEIFHLFTLTLLTLLLPLSFLLLAKFSYLQTLTWQWHHFPYLLTLALHISPLILHVLVSIVTIASLIHAFTGKIIILGSSDSSSSWSTTPRLLFAWILLCACQVCVGLGIEGSIEAGLFDSSFGVEVGLLSREVFLLGLHESTQVWARMVVRPVVDDTVFGLAREERWVERVGVAGGLGVLWWLRLRENVENLVLNKDQFMDLRVSDFVPFCLYYLTVTIGMVRLVKPLMWLPTICPIFTVLNTQNDHNV
ncbi:hypothetical protein Fmac_006769 [Flemingia macrophylla]|uniref:Transmembrane protein n=1 Tax=Flemingia macrophylla TaxID=520843 RepID=A0ABD1NBJ5_9FABA